jgi:Na+/proline symporter
VLVLMPVAACVVAGGGWIARGLVHAGVLPELEPGQAFFIASEFLSRPGIFGLIVAALTAALMSTVDTLVTAVSAIAVNDVYQPYVRPRAGERELLLVARVCALGVTVLGVTMVPAFMEFDSIYSAHGAFTAAVTPPLVVTLLCSVFWRRFTRTAALCTLVGGAAAIAFSGFVPEVIAPFAHGVPTVEVEGLLGGFRQYKFMRAFYGLSVSGVIAVVVTLVTRREPHEHCRGLVWGTVADALRHYKGSPGTERRVTRALAAAHVADADGPPTPSGLPTVRLSRGLAQALHAEVGDLLYVTDSRRWLGGLHSAHAIVREVVQESGDHWVEMGPAVHLTVVAPRRAGVPIRVERLY